MKSLLKKIFIANWPRKILSIILAVIIWLVVNKTLTTTKTINNVRVKVVALPPGKTVEGIQSSQGYLNTTIDLVLTGNKTLLDQLQSKDIEVVLDSSNKGNQWIATVTKNDLRPASHSDINLSQGISKIAPQNIVIKLTKLVTDKIPITISKPIGEAPKGYQFIDIWPYKLFLTVSGPEDVVNKLRESGLKLTFNLNDISKGQLDELRTQSTQTHDDIVSYYVPPQWKQISLPLLYRTPIEINDPHAKCLRIDFFRYELLKIDYPIPVEVFFPPNRTYDYNPQKIHLIPNQYLEIRNGIKVINGPLYAKGVSPLFLETVKNMIQITILLPPKEEQESLDWSIQFVDFKKLEDRYVHLNISDPANEEPRNLQPQLYEEYLRNRFRNYMNLLQLYKSEKEPFTLCPYLQGNAIITTEKK
jgi:hypothetical protein